MSIRRRHVCLLWLATLACVPFGRSLQANDDDAYKKINPLVKAAIEQGDLPGAVICFADSKSIRYLETFGDRWVEPQRQPMSADTVFDLASITKPVATATSIAMLHQQGKIKFDEPVSSYLPEFTGKGKESITIKQCLLHTSGLTPDNALSDYKDGEKLAWERICNLPLRSEPGTNFSYSDVGFIVLGKVIQRVSGNPLDRFAKETLFEPMGMSETTFNPPEELKRRAAPTEKQNGEWLCGTVHDPRAARLNGVAGHAGLFSTANDLVRFGQEILAASKNDSSVINDATFKTMTTAHEVPRDGKTLGTRTLGWDHQSPYSSNRGTELSGSAFGHGGFTGTVLWIDPEKDLVFVFLSSRLHPDGKGTVNKLAGKIASLVAEKW